MTCLGCSGVASPKFLGGGKMFDLGDQKYFCLDRRFTKHKMTRYGKNLREWPPRPPWLRLC